MTYTPPTMPYVDGLLMEVLRDNEGLPDGVTVGTLQPNDITLRLPYVVAATFGGTAGEPRFSARPQVQIDCYATSRPSAASLAESCRLILMTAWLNQVPYENGTISRVQVMTAPAQLPMAIDGVVRWHATYQLTVRPAAP